MDPLVGKLVLALLIIVLSTFNTDSNLSVGEILSCTIHHTCEESRDEEGKGTQQSEPAPVEDRNDLSAGLLVAAAA